LIVHDHRSAPIAAWAFALGISLVAPSMARASSTVAAPAPDPVPSAATLVSSPALPATAPAPGDETIPVVDVDVELTCEGQPIVVSTKGESVGAFLADHNIRVTQDDFVSAPLDSPLVEGMHLSFRSSKVVTIVVGNRKLVLHSAAATIRDVLHDAHIKLGARDDVSPSLAERPLYDDVIRVSRGASSLGSSRKIVASRIIRRPRSRIVERVTPSNAYSYSPLASAAHIGFTSFLRFAGATLHMIATAYTAGCYGCSGITATGARAGFGIIAVDPHIIPLGTKLFIPGYGRAVAGDTGGAIHGHRVDLGMSTIAQALRFGRRPITVYVLR